MRFTISRQELLEVASHLQNLVPVKPVLPILSHILIEAKGQELLFTATDLTVGMSCRAEAKITEEGSATFPARRFFQLIKELPHASLQIKAHNQMIEITAGSSVFKLHGLRKEDYPALPNFTNATKIKLGQKELKEAFWATSFAVSREESRYALMGLFMGLQDGKATFVGTDGKRLAKTRIDVPSSHTANLTIPIKAVEEMQKLLGDKESIALFLMSDKIALETEKALFVTKLLSSEFPNFDRVIPQNSPVSVNLHREELSSLLRQVSLFTGDQNQAVRFLFRRGELLLEAGSSEIGEGRVAMPVDYTGEDLQIAFNPTYFIDILRHSHDETIKLQLTDSFNPGLITDSSEALFIIMPMRLQSDS